MNANWFSLFKPYFIPGHFKTDAELETRKIITGKDWNVPLVDGIVGNGVDYMMRRSGRSGLAVSRRNERA